MRSPWTGRLAVLLLGGMLGLYCSEEVWPWVTALFLLCGLRLWFWKPDDFFGRLIRPELILLLLTFIAGGMYGISGLANLPQPLEIRQFSGEGELLDWTVTEEKGEGIFHLEHIGAEVVFGESDEEPYIKEEILGKRYRLKVYRDGEGEFPKGWEIVEPGDKIGIQGRLEQPKALGTTGGFDYRVYNAARGLNGSLTAKGELEILQEGSAPLVWRIKAGVGERIASWTPAEQGIMEGILFGDDGKIPSEVKERYQITGVLHVFAASGSNVAFVMLMAWGMFFFLPRFWRIWGCIGVVILYAGLCGASPPIMRASIMGVGVLLSRLWQGRVSSLRCLLLAGTGLFIYQPVILKDIGFQLSFMATWGMTGLIPWLNEVKWIRRIPLWLRSIFTTSAAAQLATLPLLVSAFHRLSLIGLLANGLVLGMLGGVLQLGLIGTLLSLVPWGLGDPLFQAALWLIHFSDYLLAVLAAFPWADVWVMQPGVMLWMGWYLGMGTMLMGIKVVEFRLGVMWRRVFGRKIKMPSLRKSLAVLFLIILLCSSSFSGQNGLEIAILDVGQGDAALITTPEKHAILIDTGPASAQYDAGERVIIPYLLEKGIKKLDALLITHEDTDHIGGAKSILGNISVGWIGVPDVGSRLESEEWSEGVPYELRPDGSLITLKKGDRIEMGSGAWIEVIGPVNCLEGTRSDSNNNSLVLNLYYEGQSMMLTGDMEEEEMEDIQAEGQELNVTFFKEPHHGSRFSLLPTWMDQLEPKGVFISVGRNSFGHPDPTVLDYWEQRGVEVYRTDQAGTIILRMGRKGTEIITGR